MPESDEDHGVGTGGPATPGGGRGGRGGGAAPAEGAQGETPAAPAPAPRTPVTVQIDFDGIQQRIVAVAGVPVRPYSELRAGVGGDVYYLEAGTGAPGATGSILHRYRLSDRKTAVFMNGVSGYDLSADGHKLVYVTRGGGEGGRGRGAAGGPPPAPSVFLVDADRQPPQAGQGRLNFALRMYLEPQEEFKQIFYEGWRNQRDYLYVPNMHGADWPRMKEMYGQLLPYVMHRADLNYLLDKMGAEIAIGHSFVRGGDMPAVPSSPGGLLGADFAIDNGRYKITRIYDGESWNPDLRAPLAEPGLDVAVGDYILAINGEELRAPDNIYRLLDGTANRQTVLTVNSRPSMDGARQITVVPVRQRAGAADARLGGSEPPAGG